MLLLAIICSGILCDGFSPVSLHHGSCSVSSTSLYDSKSSEIQNKMKAQMEKLQERDRSSSPISPDVSAFSSSSCDCDVKKDTLMLTKSVMILIGS